MEFEVLRRQHRQMRDDSWSTLMEMAFKMCCAEEKSHFSNIAFDFVFHISLWQKLVLALVLLSVKMC